MSGDFQKLFKKWSIIKEQLVALCALNELPKGNEEFSKLLCEDFELEALNSQNLMSVCYFILGVINSEERDKLIRWPVINITTRTKFRKGMSTMVKGFQEKFPWAHIRKLPESYFMNPHGYQSGVLDFLLRITNLAIHVALNDSELLFPHSGDGLNSNEIAIMTDIVSKARVAEEMIIKNKVIPLKEVEVTINKICDKCIALSEENYDLQQQLDSMKKQALCEKLVSGEKNIDISMLKEIRDKKLSELNTINEELSKYHEVSKELLLKIKAFENPSRLGCKDFQEMNSPLDLKKSTSTVCGNLCCFFQYLASIDSSREKEQNFLEQLKFVREAMKEENEALCSFLSNISLTSTS